MTIPFAIEALPGFLDGRLAKKATTPYRAVRARCLYCAGSWPGRTSPDTHCELYPFARSAGLRKSREKAANAQTLCLPSTPAILDANCPVHASGEDMPRRVGACVAIRKHCLDCCGGSQKEVELCVEPSCPAYRYRFGMGPATAAKQGKLVNPKTRLTAGVLYLEKVA